MKYSQLSYSKNHRPVWLSLYLMKSKILWFCTKDVAYCQNKHFKVFIKLCWKKIKYARFCNLEFTGKQFSELFHWLSHVHHIHFEQSAVVELQDFKINPKTIFWIESMTLALDDFDIDELVFFWETLSKNPSIKKSLKFIGLDLCDFYYTQEQIVKQAQKYLPKWKIRILRFGPEF